MMSMFARATRTQVPLKIGLTGPSGSGKTTAALRLARGLVGPDAPIALVDTENGSASLYADETTFDVVNMNPPYSVAKFLQAIEGAVQGGYKALIIDSGSAEWSELLSEKEAMDARGGNSFANWGAITKKHEDFLKAIRNAPIHLVLCLRAKQEHVQDKDDKGKTTIRKVGMAAVQRDGMEYELTTVFDLAMDHNYKVSKDRTRLFDGRMEMISVATGQELATWLQSGAPLAENTGEPAVPTAAALPTPTPTARPTQAPAPAATPAPTKPPSTPPATTQKTQRTSTPNPVSAPTPVYPPEWVEAMTELVHVTMGMPAQTRNALVAGFEADGPESLPALLAEIASIKSVMEPATPGAAINQMTPPAKAPVSQLANDFVDDLVDGPKAEPIPDTDEANGGIDAMGYGALNMLIGAYKINRDALRAYCFKAGHLLPSTSGPTLARLKQTEFNKLRDKLYNTKIAADGETWSARTVRIINNTPTTYSPVAAAS